MPHTFHFVSGLPRSGSTLLVNILGQNPRFHVTATSGVLEIISGIRAQWDATIEFRACPNDAAKKRVMAGVLELFYADVERPVVFDKCRGWLTWLEWLEDAFGPVKVLVPVRDVRAILSSMEKLWRKNHQRHHGLNAAKYLQHQTVEGRCASWLEYDSPLGIAHNRVRDAIARGWGDRLHFVHYERLMADPAGAMRDIYAHLGEPQFIHNFAAIQQLTVEDDAVYGMGDLHTIRTKLEPARDDWREVLGPFAERYAELNIPQERHEHDARIVAHS